jgi:hypothetical protein
MNERIRELAIEAGAVVYGCGYGTLDFDVEKFAELIVRECADFVAAGEFGDPGTAKMLMEDFGVEEKTK